MKRFSSAALTVSLAILCSSCGGGMANGGGTPPASSSIYVTSVLLGGLPSSVLEFPTTASGDISPTSTIKGSSNSFFNGLAVDATGNVYVGTALNASGNGGIEILVYAPGATGTATPIRTISGAATGLDVLGQNSSISLAVDSAGNIYVAAPTTLSQNDLGVSIFSATANGDVAPTRVIAGIATDIQFPNQIAVDSAGNVYVANSPFSGTASIFIFNSSANGNVPPTSVLGGSATTMNSIQGLAVDNAGNIYVAANALDGGTPGILEFSAGSTGNVAPVRTISGPATTIIGLGNIAVDGAGSVYVLSPPGILKFASSVMGDAAPTATITSISLTGDDSIAVQ
jgi:sugar lactone lactonase YvrE